MRSLNFEGEITWMKELVASHPVLRTLPEAVKSRLVVTPGEWRSLPGNKRLRKKWRRDGLVAHWFAGKEEGFTLKRAVQQQGGDHEALIEVDILRSSKQDLLEDGGLYAGFVRVALDGKLLGLLGGPNCRTRSVLRHYEMPDRPEAPRPIRRWGGEEHGIEEATKEEKQMIEEDDVMMWRMVFLFIVAEYLRQAREEEKKVRFAVEQPATPKDYRPEVVSWWDTQEWKKLAEEFDFKEYTFNQGDLGGAAKKPTTFGGNLVMELPERKGTGSTRFSGPQLNSKELARWSSGTMVMVAKALLNEVFGEVQRRIGAVSWEEHLAFGHTPYRKDCLICQECQQKERPHRKLPFPRASVLSLDCAGPLPVAPDANSGTAKFMLVGAFTWAVPRGATKLKEPEDEEDEESEEQLEVFKELQEDKEEDDIFEDEEKEDEEKEEKKGEDEEEENQEGTPGDYEMRVFRMATPLSSKQGQEVLRGAMEFILRLKMDGYHVGQVHTDQGGEFGHTLKKWLKNRGITMTRTPGDSPQSNGRAEVAVQSIKAQVRKILRQAGVGVEWWPWAVRHLNEVLRCYRLETKPSWPLFLQEVHTKKRHWKARSLEPTMEVVKYLSPAWEDHGHWIVREGAKPSVTRYVLQKVKTPVDEGVWVALEKDLMDGLTLRRRVRGKTTVRAFDVMEGAEKIWEEGSMERRQELRMKTMKVIEEEMESMFEDEEESFKTEAAVIAKMKKMGEVQEEEEEVLQTKVVSPHEAAREWDRWIPAADSEIGSLLEEKQALRPVEKGEVEEMVREAHRRGRRVQFLPSKIVLTRKPGKNGGKRKLRWVVCGNYEEKSPQEQTFAGGCDSTSFRLMVHLSSCFGWEGGTVDVRTAFLNADMNIKEDEDLILVRPPTFLVDRQYMKKDTCYEPLKAVYGFRRSPRLWGDLRDETLVDMKVIVSNEEGEEEREEVLRLVPLRSEPNLWKIIKEGDQEEETPKLRGLLMTYVDDMFICGEGKVIEELMKTIRRTWTTSEPDRVSRVPIRFLGMDVSKRFDEERGKEVWFVSQESYIKDMLERENIKEKIIPISKDQAAMEAQEGEEVNERLVKEAQKEVGELLWLVTRTRPDLCYAVARMSSSILKCPKKVLEVASQTKGYLKKTSSEGLCFDGDGLQSQVVHAYSDASFAPDGQNSHGCVIVCLQGSPVFWRSGRQGMITLSTAEAELLELVEAMTAGESVFVIVQELCKMASKVGWCDSQSAISVLISEGGSWRTRHLRLRSNFARQAILAGEWSVHHIPGAKMVADLGTKALTSGRINDLKRLLGMSHGLGSKEEPKKDQEEEEGSEEKKEEEEKEKDSHRAQGDHEEKGRIHGSKMKIQDASQLVKLITLAASIQVTKSQGDQEGDQEEEHGGIVTMLMVAYTTMVVVMTLLVQLGINGCLRRMRERTEEEERRVEGKEEERRVEGKEEEEVKKTKVKKKGSSGRENQNSFLSSEAEENDGFDPTASSSNAPQVPPLPVLGRGDRTPERSRQSKERTSTSTTSTPQRTPAMSTQRGTPSASNQESFEVWMTKYGTVYHVDPRCRHLLGRGSGPNRRLTMCPQCQRRPIRGERIFVAGWGGIFHVLGGCTGNHLSSYRMCATCGM